MAPELDQLLGRSDYGEYWLKEAKHHAQRRGWRADRLEQTLSILESTFGADWLQQEARRPERAALSGETAKHPVAHMLAVPSATSVASAIELAVYLQRCAAVPRYSDVVSCLKASPQLDGTVIQLAFGYRFQRLGCTGLEFEPPVDDGRRSDLVFEHGGVSYLVECYRPKELTNQNFKELVNESLPRISAAAQEAG